MWPLPAVESEDRRRSWCAPFFRTAQGTDYPALSLVQQRSAVNGVFRVS